MAVDEGQRALDQQAQYVAALNYYLNNASGVNDQTVGFGRDVSNNLTLFDSVTGTKTLAQLSSGGQPFLPVTFTGTYTIPAGYVAIHHDAYIANGATLAIGDGAELVLV